MDIRIYKKMNNFFFQYIRNLNMSKKENNNHLPIINDFKNEKFREKLKNIVPLFIEI